MSYYQKHNYLRNGKNSPTISRHCSQDRIPWFSRKWEPCTATTIIYYYNYYYCI